MSELLSLSTKGHDHYQALIWNEREAFDRDKKQYPAGGILGLFGQQYTDFGHI